jgi:pimeloyl-ACP methyl ester carboxylesterase
VHGDADRVVAYENGVELSRRLPNARLETFSGAGHLLFLEEPERFNRLVEEFLA